MARRYYPGGRITGLLLPAMIFLLLFGATALFILMKKTRPLLITLFLTPLLFFWLTSIVIVPQVNGFYSPRSLGEKIRFYTRQGYRAAGFGLTRGILNFYADTTIEELDDDSLSRFFAPPYSGKRVLIIKSRHLKKNPRLQQQAQIRYQYKMNNETYLLLTAAPCKEGLWP